MLHLQPRCRPGSLCCSSPLGMGPNSRRPTRSRPLLLLLLCVSAGLAADARAPRSTFDTYMRLPPRYQAVDPSAPFSSFYRPYGEIGYASPSRGLPEDPRRYDTYLPTPPPPTPTPSYPSRRNYYNNGYAATRPYVAHPLRDELNPPVYNPYFYPYQRRASSEHPFAAFWRPNNPYFRTRYFENFRPPWLGFYPSNAYFPAGAYSDVSLPPRLYYPHFLHTSNAHSILMNVLNHNRRPTPDQFLVFIPDMEEINQPDLTGQLENEEPFEEDKPLIPPPESSLENVVVNEPSEATDSAMTTEAPTVPIDTDFNQPQTESENTYPTPPSQEKPATESLMIIYPAQDKDAAVTQSEKGNEASTESVFSPSSTEGVFTSTDVVDSSVNPPQAADPEREISVTTSSPESQHNEGISEEITTEGGVQYEEEYPDTFVTEVPDRVDAAAAAQIKPDNETKEPATEQNEEQNAYEVTETLVDSTATATTLIGQDEDSEGEEATRSPATQSTTPTTEKAVYVQLHLLEQDNSTATATPTPPTADAGKESSTPGDVLDNTSESSIFFLGEMHNDEPNPSHDRIYKRYSETRARPKLSLDFKTGHLLPSIV